ncbi:MAG: AMP-binding protein [Chloroflexia bacterium]|nr:AMP-binding protein [Chloroflexia bacterium]
MTFFDEKGNEEFRSYAEILVSAKKVLTGFRNAGVQPKDKIIFQLKDNQDFVTAFWACQLGGFIPVPLTVAPTYKKINNDVKKLSNAWVMLDHPRIISDAALKPDLDSLNSMFDDWKAETVSINDLIENEEATEIHNCDKNDVAILLLTSGSTGMPKAVQQPHINLIRRSAGTSIFNKHHKDDVSFNWMPLDHVGGFVMFTLRDTFNLCHHMVAPTNYVLEEPLRWLDIMSKHKVSVTWAPNFAYGLVNDRIKTLKTDGDWDLSNLRFILNAGEAIVAKTARLFMSNLLKYKIQPTAMKPCWGMSETCSGVTFNHDFLLENTSDEDPYVVVGEPIPGFEIRITDSKGNPVENGETGNLEVRGTTVTIGYFNNDKVNKESYTDDGWFRTGDLGILNGRSLIIAGRKKDEIIINGVNYNNAEIELVVDEIEEVETSFTAVCAFRENNTNTDKIALFFNPKNPDNESLKSLIGKIKEKVIQSIGINLDVIVPVEKEQIPKTGIGKIQRAKLKDQLLAGEFDTEIKKVDLLLQNNKTLPNWFFQKSSW